MRCYSHSEREANAVCVSCGKFICDECKVDIHGKNMCKKCLQELTSPTFKNPVKKWLGFSENEKSEKCKGNKASIKSEDKRGTKNNESSRSTFILAILSFFAPLGFNYLYLGLKKKAMFFLAAYTLSYLLIFPIVAGVHAITMFIVPSVFMLAFRIVIFHDSLKIKEKLDDGIEVLDGPEAIKEFYNSNIVLITITGYMFAIAIFKSIFGGVMGNMPTILIIYLVYVFGSDIFDDWMSDSKEKPKDSEEQPEEKSAEKCSKDIVEVKEESGEKIETIEDSLLKLTDLTTELNKKRNIFNVDMKIQAEKIADVSNKMVSFIDERPEQVIKLNKFISYYMPTTLQLLDSYEKLEQQPEGIDISGASRDIENAINNLAVAFTKQFDILVEQEVANVNEEINVLNNSLEKEGLL